MHLVEGTWLSAFGDLKGIFNAQPSAHIEAISRRKGEEEGRYLSHLAHSGRGVRLERGFQSPDFVNDQNMLNWFCGGASVDPYWQRLLFTPLGRIDLERLVTSKVIYLGMKTSGQGGATGIGWSIRPRGIGSGIAQT
jgi:hypothetical protein